MRKFGFSGLSFALVLTGVACSDSGEVGNGSGLGSGADASGTTVAGDMTTGGTVASDTTGSVAAQGSTAGATSSVADGMSATTATTSGGATQTGTGGAPGTVSIGAAGAPGISSGATTASAGMGNDLGLGNMSQGGGDGAAGQSGSMALAGSGSTSDNGGTEGQAGAASTGGAASGEMTSTGITPVDQVATCDNGPLDTPVPNCEPLPVPDSGDFYADCVARINQFRWECQCLPPLERWTEGESCANQQAEYDYNVDEAHAGIRAKVCESNNGGAQNECPGYGPNFGIVDFCLQQMWDEGPGEDFNAHGHYINMSSTDNSKVACGIYTTPDGEIWSVQNFTR